ncbi:MAG: oxidoreductase [Propionibacteriaceae bacterium]|jgi:nucleoside-diphosphate-sugar epimerase|nr:oxidoreductase [Propionibacteriaceae bacterium]
MVVADRDRPDALAPVMAPRRWDAVVDVATQPGHVRRAVRDLGPAASRFVFVSSANAYASLAGAGVTEDAPLHPPLASGTMPSPADYGPAKVACEQAVIAGFGAERSAVVRPGLIGGPGDPTGRSSYWPARFARPSNPAGDVLAPDAAAQPTSMIDVRDLAAWVVRLAEGAASGVFNATGDPAPFEDHIAAARAVAGHRGRLVTAPADWLLARGVAPWMGPRSLPLWLPDRSVAGLGALSNARARAAGLALRPLSQTLADTLAWVRDDGVATAVGAGLADAEELELLPDARQRGLPLERTDERLG